MLPEIYGGYDSSYGGAESIGKHRYNELKCHGDLWYNKIKIGSDKGHSWWVRYCMDIGRR